MDDEFFDTPRQKPPEKKSSKNSRAVDPERTVSEYSDCNKDSGEPVGKPPAYPDNRPVSAASKQRVNGRKLPAVCEGKLADDPQVQNSRRVIEAKVPCVSVKQGNEESYSVDSFVEEDDGSPIEGSSGRRLSTPRTVKADQRLVSKETSIPGYDVRPHATENRAQDLSDCSGSLTDDAADSDEDSEIVDVSPINTPRDSNVQIASALTKNISKSPDIQPVGLLNADRDSLDLDMLLQTVLHMEKQGRSQSRQAEAELAVTSGSSRRNYSFNRERVEAIEKENLRLATRLMKHANDNKKAKVKVNKLHTSGVSSKRLSSAAVNRAKQQQKIEAENLMLLKRLQQVRPTKELCRDVVVGSKSAGRGSSMRPLSAGRAHTSRQRPGSSRRARPTSACSAVQHYPCTSRPATAFQCRPDDDDILTWQPDDF